MRRTVLMVTAVVTLAVAGLVLSGCGPQVPDVVGMRQADAVRALQDAGYKLGDVSAVATDGVPLGMIAAQKPAAGERAREGAAVSLAIALSDGKRVLTPVVTGLSPLTAENTAKTLNLVPVTVEQYSDDTAKDLVAAQSPEPGAEVDAGSTLLIVVSKGKAPEKAKVPDVKGDAKDDAQAAIEKAGFTVETFEVYDSETAKGDVMGQEPKGGESATVGSKVQIIVSKGKGTGAATVPKVTGKKEADAVKALEDKGFKVQKTYQYNFDVAKGIVAAQFPDADSTAAKGSEVLILISKGAQPAASAVVPEVLGLTADDAMATLEAESFTVSVKEIPVEGGDGTVLYQFPEAGTEVAPESGVMVAVGVAPQ